MSLGSRFRRWMACRRETQYQRRHAAFDHELTLVEAVAAFPDPNRLYAYMHHYFRFRCPGYVRDHREYFKLNKRGFGEDAFHAMWSLLLHEHRPKQCLEIGVYRGQVISLWALIAQMRCFPCEIHGISPFSPQGDAVSAYMGNVDYLSDTLASFTHLRLPVPTLLKALSTDPAAIEYIGSRSWDLIYIDGSHDYEIALADYQLCREHLAPSGLLVLDDASLGTSFRPPSFSFGGHPGPSRVAREYAAMEMQLIAVVGHNNVFRKKSLRSRSIGVSP